MIEINLVKDLDSLEGGKKINVNELKKDKIYSILLDFPDMGQQIKPKASFKEFKRIVNIKEFNSAKIYVKEGGYFS
jgi:hypothetical protein